LVPKALDFRVQGRAAERQGRWAAEDVIRGTFKASLVVLALLVTACQEINYVTVIAPAELMGATVVVPRTELRTQLTNMRSDTRVESAERLPLPPMEQTLVVEKPGCDRIEVAVPIKLGETTVVIPAETVRCRK